MGRPTASELVREMKAGSRVALARLISKVENRDRDLPELLRLLFPDTGRAQIWGVTGPPGAGKSTLVDRMAHALRAQSKRVAIVAVDPSSPFSGGAILGDRIRMQAHATDAGVYIRSLGTRGKHGGVSHATREVVIVLDAAGFDVVLVETAGVGQTELDILKLAESIVVVLVPESGDSIQAMKAGLMEIADIFVVNKSDRPEADRMVRDLTVMIGMAPMRDLPEETWSQPVIQAEATRDVGTLDVLKAIDSHQKFLTTSGMRQRKAEESLKRELHDLLIEQLSASVEDQLASKHGHLLMKKLLLRELDPITAATELFKGFQINPG